MLCIRSMIAHACRPSSSLAAGIILTTLYIKGDRQLRLDRDRSDMEFEMSTESDIGVELTERHQSSSITVPDRAQKDTVLRRNVSVAQSVSI